MSQFDRPRCGMRYVDPSPSLTVVREHLEAAHRQGRVREWCPCGPYVEITWADRSRSLVERERVIARLRAVMKP